MAMVVHVKVSRAFCLGKSGRTLNLRHETSHQGDEVVDAILPGKASKLQIIPNRTPNRHRWSGREY
eukprot:TRINITY_DN472_c0_g1_i1.p1 TRINITY_DN472_c0_g1~~TRINITY_DN472_c0_g1_i1.p1  ORF type:complete len:66 (+),score=3.86 TRINITY_DN472_c0_g1_i1:365-562(+)